MKQTSGFIGAGVVNLHHNQRKSRPGVPLMSHLNEANAHRFRNIYTASLSLSLDISAPNEINDVGTYSHHNSPS